MQRRTFLRLLAASSALPLVPACTDTEVFLQGVASGDPSPDGVLLWTRAEGVSEVDYVVATDRDLRNVVARGTASIDVDSDGTVHVEVTGLSPATVYWYRFSGGGTTSQVGRTKTAPLPDADVPLRVAVASCQDFGGRWFHAWQSLVERDDIDVVLFIGDYIYETIGHLDVKLPASRTPTIPDGLVLEDPLKGQMAALTLADYRALYRQYRLDPDLQAVHARFPFVMLWDDHEFANDCWGDHATDFDDLYGDEASPERFAAAAQAWFEYSPIRKRESIYRSFRWGRHAEFVLIDERSYRDDFVVPEGPIDAEVGHIMANSAFGSRTFVIKDAFDAREATKQPTMIGMPQREWAISTLTSSTATWKLLVSPLVMTQMVIDLTGFEQLLATNPAIVHADSTHNGVAVVDITAQAIEVQFIRTSDVTMPNGHETDVVKFRTALGSRRVEKTL